VIYYQRLLITHIFCTQVDYKHARMPQDIWEVVERGRGHLETTVHGTTMAGTIAPQNTAASLKTIMEGLQHSDVNSRQRTTCNDRNGSIS